MKKFLPLFICCLFFVLSCNMKPYDDSNLEARIEQLEKDNKDLTDRVSALEKFVNDDYLELVEELEYITTNYITKEESHKDTNALGKKINSLITSINNLNLFYATTEDFDTVKTNLENLQKSVDLLQNTNTFTIDTNGSLLLFNDKGLLYAYILKELGSDGTSFQATIYNPILVATYNDDSFTWVYGERNSDPSEKYDNNITYHSDEDYFVFKGQRNNSYSYKQSIYILLNKENSKVTQHTIKNIYAYNKHSNEYYYPGRYSEASSLGEYISLFTTDEYLNDSNYGITTNEYSSWYSSKLSIFSSWSSYLNSAVEFYRNK